MSNKLNNLADKAISDEELEQVSGGALYPPKTCPMCLGSMYNTTGHYICSNPNCGYQE